MSEKKAKAARKEENKDKAAYTIKELREKFSAFVSLFNSPLPGKAAYHLGKVKDIVQEEMKRVWDLQNKIAADNGVVLYSEAEPKTGDIKSFENEAGKEAYQKSLDEMLEQEVVFKDYPKLSISELGRAELTPMEMSTLSRLFTE